MSISIDLLEHLGAVQLAYLRRIEAGQATVTEIRNDVVLPRKWQQNRHQIHHRLQHLVDRKWIKRVDVGRGRLAYKITEPGRRAMRKAIEFYRSV